MKGYIVKHGEIGYRFDTKKAAVKFYEENKQDYMDKPYEIDIDEKDWTALMAWYTDGCRV